MIAMHRRETVRLTLDGGGWLDVKKHITAGDDLAIQSRVVKWTPAGREVDPYMVGLSIAMTYLLDWNLENADGAPIAIKDHPPELVQLALEDLDPEILRVIRDVITEHHVAMTNQRAEEKKRQAPAPA